MPGDVAIQRIATMLAARRAELATESLSAIRAAIPTYAEIDDPVILADVTEHVAENHDALRASLVRGDRSPSRISRSSDRTPRSAPGAAFRSPTSCTRSGSVTA